LSTACPEGFTTAGITPLHLRELLDGVDVAEPQVVRRDVENHAHVARVEAEPGAKDPAASRLEHGDVDLRV
jgi:hypothetical protein